MAALLAVLACLMAGSATAGTLTVTRFSFGSAIPFNLSAEGEIDWAHWGTFTATDFEQKAGVTHVIPNFTALGSGGVLSRFGGAFYIDSWVDGTTDQRMANTQGGLQVTVLGNGYQLVIPASTTTQYLFLYAGRSGSAYQLEASLSDGPTSAVSVTNAAGSLQSRFTIAFAANSPGQTMTIKYYQTTVNGNVTLIAAALASAATLPLSVAAPTLSSPSTVQAGSTIGLLANPHGVNSDGSSGNAFSYQWQVDGVNIPNGTSNPINVAIGSVGVHNYQVVVTNSILGGAAVTSAPVAVTVTAAVGTLSAAGVDLPALTPTPLDVDLTTEGVIDWGHWGTTGPGVYDNKANVIGDYTQIGSGAFAQFNSVVSYT
jgi:hypothetical protein